MWHRTLLLGALALSVMHVPAGATVISDPVTVRLVGERPVAEKDKTLRATFEITAYGTVEISDLAVEGEGWSGRVLAGRTARFAVTKALPSRFEIEATPSNPSKRVVVRWKADGRSGRQEFDFSPACAERRRSGRALVPTREIGRAHV
jgi:hypothetical protein